RPGACSVRSSLPQGQCMQQVTGSNLLELLRPLCTPAQLQEVANVLQRRQADAKGLLEELVRRGWLTLYQARMIIGGRGRELVLGSSVILDKLGTGGGGQVYKARHRKMDRVVALKMLRSDLLRDPEAVQRFYREIEVASRVSHPNIVLAYEAGPIGSALVLV